MQLLQETTLAHIEMLAAADPEATVWWAVGTCWWTTNGEDLSKLPPGSSGHGLPCDPRGSVLLMGQVGRFLASAKANPVHYGTQGLQTLMAAHHGNVRLDYGRPWSLESWSEYDALVAADA